MTDRTRLEWAQWIAAKGIKVFILTPKSKRPLDVNAGVKHHQRPEQKYTTVAAWNRPT